MSRNYLESSEKLTHLPLTSHKTPQLHHLRMRIKTYLSIIKVFERRIDFVIKIYKKGLKT